MCVTISYRTGVQFPLPVQDVAMALKWVKEFIEHYGGDPTNIFLSGHSAGKHVKRVIFNILGGHLVSLLATHHIYLEEQNLDHTLIKGIILFCIFSS